MKCEALVDPETRIALAGEALAAAAKNPDAPRCGYELAPDDLFCSSCGATVEISRHDNVQPVHNKRATRSAFWGSAAAFFLSNLLFFALAGENYDVMNGSLAHGIFLKILGYVGLFAYGYFIKTSIRRLHDIDRSGWLIAPSICLTIVATISTFVSVACKSESVVFALLDWAAALGNLGMVVWLGFAKGTKGPNKYGPDPLSDGNAPINLGAGMIQNGESVETWAEKPDSPCNEREIGGEGKFHSACSPNRDSPANPRTKSRFAVIIGVILFGTLSFVVSYYSRQQQKQAYAAADAFWQSRTFQDSLIGKSLNTSSERQSAERGDAEAQLALGVRYYNGVDVEQDKKEAANWFRKAAEQGNAEAQSCLGDCYMLGDGVEKDTAEAVKWYRKAADQGLAIAQRAIGLCYLNGEGVKQDAVEAVKWFRKAAEQKGGLLKLSPNGIKARSSISMALDEEGIAGAQLLLGACYECGEGVDQDKGEAVKWYRKAAEQGNDDAKDALKRLAVESE